MRKAVTFLQSVARFRINETVTAADVHEITGVCNSIEYNEKLNNLLYMYV